MTASNKQPGEDRQRRRKVAAALSAGLVVGVGMASTLAGWNYDEYAAAGFQPSRVTPTPGASAANTGGGSGRPGPIRPAPEGPLPTDAATSAVPAVTTPPTTVPPTAEPFPEEPPEPGTFALLGSVDGVSYADHASASSAAMIRFSERAARLSPGEGVAAAFALRLSRVGSGVGPVRMVATVTGTGEHLSYGMYTTAKFGCRLTTTPTGTVIPAGTPLSGTTVSAAIVLPAPEAGSTEAAPVYVCIKVKASASLVPGSKHAANWAFRADAD